MPLPNWLTKLFTPPSRFRGEDGRRPPLAGGRRVTVEVLEDRLAPSTLTVTNLLDSGAGSLRAEIGLAVAGDSVVFAAGLSGTIVLTTGELALHQSVSVTGPGAGQLTVSGGNASRVFEVAGGATAGISGLTITGGRVTAADSGGGGVLVDPGCALTVTNATVSGNSAIGGGIGNLGTLAVVGSTLSGNSGPSGGGLFNLGGAATLTSSTVSGNSATGSAGGIYSSGTLALAGSTVSGNTAAYGGGGLFVQAGTVTLTDSTVSGNSGSGGGGLFVQGGTLALAASTVSGNSATTVGGAGIFNAGGGVTLRGSIVAGNSASSDPDIRPLGGSVAATYSLVGDGTGTGLSSGAGGNLVGTAASPINPLLAPLGDYGGATQTVALLPGSPALDAGDPADAGADQRGVAVQNGRRDIGAFESRGFTLAVASGDNQRAAAGAAFAAPLAVAVRANAAGEPVAGGQVTFTAPATGAGAGFAANPAAINGSGSAAAAATANAALGSFTASAAAAGASGGPAAFHLINTTAGPAVLTVNSLADGTTDTAHLTLREAVLLVDGGGNPVPLGQASTPAGWAAQISGLFGATATVQFDPGLFGGAQQTIALGGTELMLSRGVSVVGPGAGRLAVSGGNASRVFEVAGGATAGISGLTIDNGSSGGDGGGILNDNGGTLALVNSTISGNHTSSNGGGIANNGTATLTGSTVSGNSGSGGGGISNGGALTLTDSTVSGNSATGSGGGVSNGVGGTTLHGSIVAGNSASSAPDFLRSGGSVAATYSLVGDGTGTGLSSGAGGNLVGTAASPINPLLAPLGDYGGATQTVALLPGSPALDAGDPADAGADQRGVAVQNGRRDIGAFESRGFTLAVASGDNQRAAAGAAFAAPLAVAVRANAAGEPVAGGQVTFTAPATGAGAGFAANPAAINGSGSAAAAATANAALGSFTASAAAAGASGGPAAFHLINTTAGPAVLTVNSLADGTTDTAHLTLREAVLLVDGGGNPVPLGQASTPAGWAAQISGLFGATATVQFDPGLFGGAQQTIALGGTELMLSRGVSVVGPGAGRLAVSGGNASRVFEVAGGATAGISGLTITGGRVTAADSGGGGVLVDPGCALTVTNATVSGNSAIGGGIGNLGTLAVVGSTLSGNSGPSGGGLFNLGGAATLTSSTVSGNSATGSAGGIYSSGTLALAGSTVSGNTAAYGGGGLFVQAGTVTLTDSTVSGNSGSGGGGLFVQGGTLALTASTVSGNSATTVGGAGIFNAGGGVTLRGSIVAGNSASSDPDIRPLGGSVAATYSLVGDGTGTGLSSGAGGNLVGTAASPINPLLGPLANNGGPTQTVALLAGSPAIGAGDPTLAGTADQRGVVRGTPVGIGAYQGLTTGTAVGTSVGTSVYGQSVTFTATVTFGGGSVPGMVAFSEGATPLGTFPLDGSGHAIYASAALGAGAHTITAVYLGTSTYQPSSGTAGLTVNRAVLTIVADNKSKAYGAGLPALTASYIGFVNGDTSASLTTAPTLSTTAMATSHVGSYGITASGAGAANYSISYVAGTLSVTPVALTIAADNKAKVYGQANPVLTASYSGFVNGDSAASLTTAPTLSTTATAASHVGSFNIAAAGAVDADYAIAYVAGTLSVTPAALAVTADNKSKVYGSANPALTASYGGFVNGDTSASLTTAPTLSTTATAASHVGSYAIAASGAVAADYAISYVAGTLSVARAALTVAANNASKVYGAALPALTANYSGFVNGDTAASLTTPPALSTTATAASHVGSFNIAAAGAVDADYAIAYVAGTLSVTPAALAVTADNKSKVYGSANPALTASYGGFVNGDTSASLTTAPTLSTTATAASHVGSYAVNAGGAVDADYTIAYVTGTLSVARAALTVAANSASKVYGAALPALTASYSGFVNGDTPASLTTPPALSTTATASSHAGSYAVTASGAVAADYTISYVAGTLSVTRAALTIAANNASKVYGAALPGFTASYSGFVNGDTSASLTTAPTLSTTATAASHVGSYPITAGGAVDADYTIAYVAGTLSVTPVGLTIAANNASKAYGAALPAFTASYSGFVNGDTSATLTTAPTLSTTATIASHVGSYPIAASGAVDADYTIAYVAGTLSVTRAALTITANNASKVYGAALPALTAGYSGFVNGDSAASLTTAPTLTTTATAASHVGSYAVNAGGAVDADYTIAYVAGTLSVARAALTVAANSASKVYGAALPALTAGYSGFVNGDTSASLTTAPTLSTTATAASHVGSYAIAASGAVAADYTIAYVAGTLSVTPAALTVTADSKSKVYGQANPALTASYSGLVNGDTPASLAAAPTLSTTATAASHVGGYGITASGAVDADYTIAYVAGTLSVTRAALTVAANSASKVYGAALPGLTASYSGFVNGDTSASLTTAPTLSTTATAASHAGSYPIAASGAVAADYTIGYVAGTLSVTRAALTIAANSASKVYGAALPGLTASYSGFVNGDTPASLTTAPTLSTTATTASNVGSYGIAASGASAADYTIGYVAGTLSVTPAPLTVTADDKSKTYGQANPALSAHYDGLVLGQGPDVLSGALVLSTPATAASNAGGYPIVPSGQTSTNYGIAFVSGTLTVNRASLTIAADNKSKVYGQANPALTASYAGFVNGDTPAVVSGLTLTTTASTGSGVGSYAITASGAAAANYSIGYVSGTLLVSPAALTVTADNQTKAAGDPVPALTASYSGFVNGDTPASLSSPVTLTTYTGDTAGSYPIVASGAAAANYTIAFVNGTLTVTPAAARGVLVDGLPFSVSAGSSQTVNVTVFDDYGNVATGYLGTISLSAGPGASSLPADHAFLTTEAGRYTFSGLTFFTAGLQTLTATDTANPAVAGIQNVAVTGATAASLDVSAPAAVTAGQAFSVTVTARDTWGNVATGYGGTVQLTDDSAHGYQSVAPPHGFTPADAGVYTFTAAQLLAAGPDSVLAGDGAVGGGASLVVQPGAATQLVLSATPDVLAGVTAGTPFQVTATAYDAYGNVATGYAGTATFASDDAAAVLPADHAFGAGDAGTQTFLVTLNTAGPVHLTVTDTADSTLAGFLDLTVT